MSKLERLQESKNLTEFSKLLGFTPKGISYILYKLADSKKYRTFKIPKKSGGSRTIQAPESQLALLQKRLADLLYDCVEEINQKTPNFWRASHGFQKKKTIISNAECHRRRRFVFNLDLEDFFGTINFGRVRGFFIKDKSFLLNPHVATVIAQIVCHDNSLPQGSPCSPIISNLIGNILDSRLLALAKDEHCTYTRYADDLTFSTNETIFPTSIAVNIHGGSWEIGKKLRREIESAGFKLNERKTRMSRRCSRQTVTGLVVNAKPNINKDYYRYVRAMCNGLFQSGAYYRPTTDDPEITDNLNPLEGMLSHIYFVKARRDRTHKTNKLAVDAGEFRNPKATIVLYRNFLYFKHFAAPEAPLIVSEGISDITYLQCAIRSLAASFPGLAKEDDGKIIRLVNFLRPSGTTRDILNLGHGASGQAALIAQYSNILKKFRHKPMEHPVVVLCDNDGGPKDVFKNAARRSGLTISTTTTDPFYHLGDNLYLVKIPEGIVAHPKEIEELFQPALLATELDGKPFDPKKEHGDAAAYGKVVFAEKVVRPNWTSIDFSGFSELLSRIEQCLAHYATVKAAGTSAPSAVPASLP